MAIVSDNAIDAEIQKIKTFLENLKRNQVTFSNSFQTMRPKERAIMLNKIQTDQKIVKAFLERSKKTETQNSGTRFALENVKQSFHSSLILWRRTEKSLENFTHGSAPKLVPAGTGGEPSETLKAVEKYVSAMRDVGQVPNSEMINDFKIRLEGAYAKAKEQAGGRDLEIKVVQDGSKIKVRMEPK